MEVEIKKLAYQSVRGYCFIPEKSRRGVVITLGTAEGECLFEQAYQIAEKGYRVLAIYYFGKESLPPKLAHVPVEFFSHVIQFAEQFEASYPLTIVGASRGAELAFILANHFQVVSNLVLVAPTAFIYPGEDYQPAWTLHGKPLPTIRFTWRMKLKEYFGKSSLLKEMFDYEFTANRQVPEARIDSSTFKGNLLLFSGKEDLFWPSAQMGQMLATNAIRAKSVEHYVYEEAGHLFSTKRMQGGTNDGNLYATYSMNELIEKKLAKWHV
jgi:dienelactone hydrolase